eukprot:GHRR01008220.1.p1 GENE.GHRR01008220.1~~GHRR01008220.1.p1  ORF type:complete len:107 (+),score=13.62 GHRR01008220.1:129-449(+)
MDLGQSLEGTRSRYEEEKEREMQAEEGGDVTLVVQLPDGTQHNHCFKMGATVAYVKLWIEQQHDIPMDKQELITSNGKTLIDPLSLSDCPGITVNNPSLVVVSEVA